MAKPIQAGTQQWFPEEKTSNALLPAKQVLDTHGSFRQTVKSLIKNQSKEYNSLDDSSSIATLEDLKNNVTQQISKLESADLDLNRRRSKGWRKGTTWHLSFARTFGQFLGAYSGVVTVVCLADSQFGNVATATLGLLFGVVQQKVAAEDGIQSALEQIRDRLPEMEIYNKIYPDPNLGCLLAEVYRDVVLFARDATCYCLSSRERWVHVLGKPGGFQLSEEKMRERMTSVRRRCEALLAKRVADLADKNEELVEQNRRLLLEVEGLRKSRDEDVLFQIKTLLTTPFKEGLTLEIPTTELRDQQMKLTDITAHHKLEQMSLSLLEIDEPYPHWVESSKSSLLALTGRNENKVHSQNLWLSPVLIEFIRDLQSKNQHVAFRFCGTRHTAVTVLASLLYQTLESDISVSRRCDILRILNRGTSKRLTLECLESAFVAVLDALGNPLYVVLNRPELLADGDEVDELMDSLLEILCKVTRGRLKILVDIDCGLWKCESWISRKKYGELFCIRRDQKRL